MSNSIFSTILKRATYASTGELIARISAAIAGIIIARAVGPAPFGVYAVVWVLIMLSVAFTRVGVTMGLKRDGARIPRLLPSLLGNSIIVKAIIGLCALSVAYFSLSAVTRSEKAPVLFLPLALAGFSTLCVEPLFAALYVKGRQKLVSFLMMGRGFLFLTGVGILFYFKFDIIVFAWYQGILYFVALIIVCFTVISIISISVNFSKILSQVKGSFVFGISGILYSIYTQLPILLLSHFRTEEEVGFFAVAFRFVELSLLFGVAASNNTFIPSLFGFYKTNRDKFRHICESMQKLFVPVGIFIASALYVCADTIIIILQGEEYRQAIGILRILCWIVAIHYAVLAAGASLTAADRMWIKVFFQVCTTLTTLLVGVVFIKHYGATGASYAMIILQLVLIFLYVPYAYRKKLIGFSGLAKISLPAVLMVLLALIIVQLIPDYNLLTPAIFFIGTLFIWLPVAMEILKHSIFKPYAKEL